MSTKDDIEFLIAYQKELEQAKESLQQLCYPMDFVIDDDPQHCPKAERAARLAFQYGFNDDRFRRWVVDGDPTSQHSFKNLNQNIAEIPRIIQAIEVPPDRSIIPDNVELLTVPQVALLLGWGQGIVREREKRGLLPKPVKIGGTIQWNRKELHSWLNAGCPARLKWEQMRKEAV